MSGPCRLIAITGTIGAGKSRVTAYWATICSLPVVDLDAICRQLLCRAAPGWLALRQSLDKRFFHANGELDRSLLREAIAGDTDLRSRVDALIHPLARQEMHDQVNRLAAETVLVEVPLLFEAGWENEVDRVVVVYCSMSSCCRRIVMRDRVDAAQASRLVLAQMDPWSKALRADHVIDNSGAWAWACLQIRHLASIFGLEF